MASSKGLVLAIAAWHHHHGSYARVGCGRHGLVRMMVDMAAVVVLAAVACQAIPPCKPPVASVALELFRPVCGQNVAFEIATRVVFIRAFRARKSSNGRHVTINVKRFSVKIHEWFTVARFLYAFERTMVLLLGLKGEKRPRAPPLTMHSFIAQPLWIPLDSCG